MSTASAIVNGTLDTTHAAVVTVISDASNNELAICTGTIVKVDVAQGIGWVATAAHCVNEGSPRTVWEGSDYLGRDRVRHNVLGYAADSRFDIDKPENGYDFAVVRISGVTASTAVIPLATAPDSITTGTTMDNVGFGRTTRPPATADGNSKRHMVSASITKISQLLLGYDTSEQGACQGDSGGPWLVGDGTSMRVVGIDSYGNTTCDGIAYAGRVQAGQDFFAAELGDTPPDKCTLCTTLVQSSGGKCATAKNDDLTSCICSDACATECSGTTQCAGGASCIGNACDPAKAGTTSDNATPTTADAGSNILLVEKSDGGGCSTAPGRGAGSASVFAGLALVMLFRRRRR